MWQGEEGKRCHHPMIGDAGWIKAATIRDADPGGRHRWGLNLDSPNHSLLRDPTRPPGPPLVSAMALAPSPGARTDPLPVMAAKRDVGRAEGCSLGPRPLHGRVCRDLEPTRASPPRRLQGGERSGRTWVSPKIGGFACYLGRSSACSGRGRRRSHRTRQTRVGPWHQASRGQ